MGTDFQLHFEDRASFRKWLHDNHDKVALLWMVFFKKHTGRPNISYNDAVEEALCYGWIDSIIKRLDDDRFLRKFTPRTDPKKWSATNLRRVQKLIASGQMTDLGMALIPTDVKPLPAVSERTLVMPAYMASRLKATPEAYAFFQSLAPSYRRNYIHWISSAKREETRMRRLSEAVDLLSRKQKLGMK